MQGAQVIDADAHLPQHPNDEDVRPHMEKYGNAFEPVLPSVGWDPSDSGRMAGVSWNLEMQLRAMDKEGIDVSVLFPTRGLVVNLLPDSELALHYCRGYNNYVAGVCKQSPRLKAVAIVPFNDVPAAMGEVKRAVAELGLAGILLASLGLREHVGSATYWPIYEEIQNLNVPLLVHNSYAGPGNDRRADTFLFQETVGSPLETLISCVGLMYGGIPERFPRLRVAFMDVGVGWLPFYLERMNKDVESDILSRGAASIPLLKAPPSEYISRGNWYFTARSNESMLPYVVDTIGADKILFGSCYPDSDGLFPKAVSTLQERSDVSTEAKRKILQENARVLFGW
jgi:predicted TIM-barrel fold metal-dependent hydrolase